MLTGSSTSSSSSSTDSLSPALISISSIQEAIKHLKDRYQTLYQRVLGIDSSCFGIETGSNTLPMKDLLDSLSIDGAELLSVKKRMGAMDCNNGWWIHDLSGVGLYALACQLANAWSNGDSLTEYENKAVLLLPIEQMHRIVPNDLNYVPQLNDLFKVWGIDIGNNLIKSENILVIVSGCSNSLRKYDAAKIEPKKWLDFAQTFPHHIIISNGANHGYSHRSFEMALNPFNLRVDHLKGRPDNGKPGRNLTCYIPGKLIMEEAETTIEQVFFKPKTGRLEGSVWTTERWHQQVQNITQTLMQGGSSVERSEIKVAHLHQPLTMQQLVLSALEGKAARDGHDQVSNPLKTPAEWFCAAATSNASGWAAYRIANYFITRKLSNNYIDNLGYMLDVPNKTREKFTEGDGSVVLLPILEELRKDPNFMTADSNTLLTRIDALKIIKYGRGMDAAVHKGYKDLIKVLRDPATEICTLSEGPPYEVIHPMVLKESDGIDIHAMVEGILTGANIVAPHYLTLGVAAIMLAEAARYPVSFITTLCMLDLIRNTPTTSHDLWKQFFGHKDDCDSYSISSIEDGVVFDILRTLGGLHPMSQGNSFNQVQKGAMKPGHGMHLVDFKSHIILMKWLAIILEKEKDISPHLSAEIVAQQDGPVVDDVLTWFMRNTMGALNPYIFDRFARRLDTFNFMLEEKEPVRNRFPNDYIDAPAIENGGGDYVPNPGKLIEFLQSDKCNIRTRLPREEFPHIGAHNSSILSIMAKLELTLFLGPSHCMALAVEQINSSVHGYLEVLARDPDFYQIHHFASAIYSLPRYTTGTINKALMHATSSLDLATKKDSFYYVSLSQRIKCHFISLFFLNATNNRDVFDADVKEYLANYEDKSDPDHWRVYAYRAIMNCKYNHHAIRAALSDDRNTLLLWFEGGDKMEKILSDENIYRDFSFFLKNINSGKNPEDSIYGCATQYMKQKLKSTLTVTMFMEQVNYWNIPDRDMVGTLSQWHYKSFIKLSEVYHCLGKYTHMLDNAFKAVVVACPVWELDWMHSLFERDLLPTLQTYYSHNKLCYSPHYAQELWNGISSGAMSTLEHLQTFLDQRKIVINPESTFIPMNLKLAPQPVPTSNSEIALVLAETSLSANHPKEGELFSFASMMSVLKGYQADSDIFKDNKARNAGNVDEVRQRFV